MHIDASGRHIWLLSQTPIDYIAIQAALTTKLGFVAVLDSLDHRFSRLDWPCGGVSFGFPTISGAETFFCVNQKLEVCIILAKRIGGSPSEAISETISAFGESLRSRIQLIEDAVKATDPE